MLNLDSKRKRETLTLIVVFALVLGVSALAVFFIAGRTTQNEATGQAAASAVNETTPERHATTPAAAPAATAGEGFIDRLFGVPPTEAHIVRGESWGEVVAKITLRLML